MRIVTAYAYDTAIANLQKRQQDLSETQTQLTSGKRVNRASDDPTAAARAERALANIARSDANKRALDASANVMGIAESALGDAVELLQSARETLVAAGNGSYSDSERKALAIKLREIRNQLLNVANRPDGGGGYVFGGQGASLPPFVDNTTGVSFEAQGGEMLASSSEKLNLTVDGEQIFLKSKTGNGIFTTGQSIDEAAWWFVLMDRCCHAQLLAEAAGTPKHWPPEAARGIAAALGAPMFGWQSFQTLWDEVVVSDPDLFD